VHADAALHRMSGRSTRTDTKGLMGALVFLAAADSDYMTDQTAIIDSGPVTLTHVCNPSNARDASRL
jgi:hypothetical protein